MTGRIQSLAPYPSLSFYVGPQPAETPLSSRPMHLHDPVEDQDVDLIQLLRQDHHQISSLLGPDFHHDTLQAIVCQVEELIGFNVYSAKYLKDQCVDDIKDIHLQSEAGQIHLLRIARSNTISADTLQTEFALHSWISKLNSGSSLPFDRAVASSWNRKAEIGKDMEWKEIEDGNDGLAWSLHEVRGGNGSTVADWKGLDEKSKLHLLSSLTQILTTLHSINLPESVSSLLDGHASDLKVKHLSLEARSTESYVYDFLSTVLDLNNSMGPSPDDQEDEEPTFSQRRGRRGDHSHRDPSSDDRSDSAVAGLSTSPETYRNAEMKFKMDQKRPNKWEEDMEKRQAWLDLIMKNFPKEEKPIDIGAVRLILNPANFLSEAQMLINSPSKTAFKPKPTRMVSLRPFRSSTLIDGLRVEKL